jgi:hypothetical protein
MRFLPKGSNPFKIQTRFKLDFASEFCNSKYIEIWKLGKKGKVSCLKLFSTMQSLENFGDLEVPFHIFQV